MALIQCPECGQFIFDRTSKCPKCGYPVQEYLSKKAVDDNHEALAAAESPGDVPQAPAKEKSKRKFVIAALVVCAVSVAVLGILLVSQLFAKKLIVEDITISKWRLTDSTKYTDYYEGTITSEQKKPFVAVIGQYDDQGSTPKFVYVEDGAGVMESSESSEEDPSIKYRPLGYMGGRPVKISDVKVKYTDSNYHDWNYSDSTSCNVLIEAEMNHAKTGILIFDISNETNHETKRNIFAAVIKGRVSYNYFADLPYKSRGIDVSIVPKMFCESSALTQKDYTIKKAYTAEKGEYSESYSGEETLNFPDHADGFVLYTSELKEGGDKENRNFPKFLSAFLRDGECTLTTYDSADEDETILMPKYEFNMVGYITWTPLGKGDKIR